MELLYPREIDAYVRDHTTPAPDILEELEWETRRKVPNPQMLTGRAEGTLLRLLCLALGARRVVDIGTYTGYSALMMASALPEGGEVITCEISPEMAEFARGYISRSPWAAMVRLELGPALETLSRVEDGSVDFVFIDADKESYADYYGQAMRVLRPGGLAAVDNALWSGRVLEPGDAEATAIARFNDMVRGDARAEKVLLTVRDGVYLIRKS
ncbi:MAG: class I SAM-dependent methyltransferase [Thermodesulfovibrionales bacterium]